MLLTFILYFGPASALTIAACGDTLGLTCAEPIPVSTDQPKTLQYAV
jgi:hypothetical protein